MRIRQFEVYDKHIQSVSKLGTNAEKKEIWKDKFLQTDESETFTKFHSLQCSQVNHTLGKTWNRQIERKTELLEIFKSLGSIH